LSQEVNEMWAGLGYYRRARFLLEVSCALLGLTGNWGSACWRIDTRLAIFVVHAPYSMFCLRGPERLEIERVPISLRSGH
jgi:hypothetical protein